VAGERSQQSIKAVGWLVSLDRETAETLRAGAAYPSEADPRVRIAALGPVQPGAIAPLVQPALDRVIVPNPGTLERPVALRLRCDPVATPAARCMVDGRVPTPGVQLRVAGPVEPLVFLTEGVLPESDAQPADVTVRFAGGPELALIARGDRDALLDERAAMVTAIERRETSGARTARLRLGVDRAADGWRYRNRPIKPGDGFWLSTASYVASGTVVAVVVPAVPPAGR
jgi:hypothetical protein